MDERIIMESSYIFSKKENTNNETVSSDSFYTIYGEQDYIDTEGNPRLESNNEKKVFAKSIGGKHYIKTGLYGRIFNPIGMYSEGKQQKFLSKVGKEEYSFARVNQKVFDLYVNFLRTRNRAWLNNAEREMI